MTRASGPAAAAGRRTTATGRSPRRCRPASGRRAWLCPGTGPGRPGPLLVPKRAGRISGGLDDMIISLYAHGMSVRDILHHLEQVYRTRLSAETVSRITDAFPATVVQRCVVHMIRNALRPVARRDAGEIAKELRKIYTAPDADAAL